MKIIIKLLGITVIMLVVVLIYKTITYKTPFEGCMDACIQSTDKKELELIVHSFPGSEDITFTPTVENSCFNKCVLINKCQDN